jgi:hypothetical protein
MPRLQPARVPKRRPAAVNALALRLQVALPTTDMRETPDHQEMQ